MVFAKEALVGRESAAVNSSSDASNDTISERRY
jgi:hypothetical protein